MTTLMLPLHKRQFNNRLAVAELDSAVLGSFGAVQKPRCDARLRWVILSAPAKQAEDGPPAT